MIVERIFPQSAAQTTEVTEKLNSIELNIFFKNKF
jgi:hypothetical protein